MTLLELDTERLHLRVIDETLVLDVLEFYERNRIFLRPWEPQRDDSFFTRQHQRALIEADLQSYRRRSGLKLWLFSKEDDQLLGAVNFSHILYGCFQSCFLGFKLDQHEQGRGYMGEALREALRFVFGEWRLHRVEANVMPTNERALKMLERLRFVREGLARRYLKIDGRWEDHVHMVRLADEAWD